MYMTNLGSNLDKFPKSAENGFSSNISNIPQNKKFYAKCQIIPSKAK